VTFLTDPRWGSSKRVGKREGTLDKGRMRKTIKERESSGRKDFSLGKDHRLAPDGQKREVGEASFP